MFKKIVAMLLVVLTLSSSMVFAQGQEFTVDQLVRYMKLYNGTIQIANINVKKMEFDHHYAVLNKKGAEYDYDQAKKDGWASGPAFHYGSKLQINHVLPQMDRALYATKGAYDMTRLGLENNVRLLIMDTFSKQEALALQTKKLDHANTLFEDAKLKFNLGLVSNTDLLTAELDQLTALKAYNDASRAHVDGIETLNKLIGFSLDKRYKIKLDGTALAAYPTYSELIDDAKANNFNLKNTQMELDNLKAKMKFIIDGEYIPFVNGLKKQYEANERQVAALELKLKDLDYGVEKDLLLGLESLHNLKSTYEQLANSITIQKNNLTAMQAQLKSGLVTEKQMKELEFAIMNMESNLEVVGFNYNNKTNQIVNFVQYGSAMN